MSARTLVDEAPVSLTKTTWARLGARLSTALRLLPAVVVLLALARFVSRDDLARAAALIAHVGWPLALVLLPTLAALALDARGWQRILALVGHEVRWRRLWGLRISVEAVALALPGGALAAEAVKLALLKRRAGVPLTAGGASLMLTKANLVGSEAVYLMLAASWAIPAALAGTGTPSLLPAILALTGATITALTAGAVLLLLREATWASRLGRLIAGLPLERLRRWGEARRAGFAALDESARGFFAAPSAAQAGCFVPFLLEWLVEGFETFLILRLLGIPVEWGEALVLDGVGSLLRALVFFVPAGLGFQDAVLILLLRELGVADAIVAGAALIFVKRTKEVFWVLTGAFLLAVRRDSWRKTATEPGA